uniref:MBD domain-containing protein n=1 Tax=Schistocephalus solidus TaxID=70667 RepID=A0A183TRI8_SCHSO
LRATPPAAGRDCIIYITPCGRRLRSPFELEHFLYNTGSQLTPDLFCFDKAIEIDQEFRCNRLLLLSQMRMVEAQLTNAAVAPIFRKGATSLFTNLRTRSLVY